MKENLEEHQYGWSYTWPIFGWGAYFFMLRESCLHRVLNKVYLQNIFYR
jgi:hypothetical protein